jgi:hypothetical protein
VLAWAFVLVVAAQAQGAPWLTIIRAPGTESCPTAAALAGAVEAELGRPPTSAVRCVLGRQGLRWQALIEIDGQGRARRTIRTRGKGCQELASALELTLTLALAARASPADAPVAQETDLELPAGLVARATPPPRMGWGLSAGAILGTGALLDVTAGLEVGARWRHGRFALALEGRGERALPATRGPAHLEGWRASGAVVPCWMPARLAVCGVMRSGVFGAHADALPVPRSARGAVAETGVRAAWRPGAGSVALYAEMTAPLLRARLLVDGRPVWAAPVAALSLGMAGWTSQ